MFVVNLGLGGSAGGVFLLGEAPRSAGDSGWRCGEGEDGGVWKGSFSSPSAEPPGGSCSAAPAFFFAAGLLALVLCGSQLPATTLAHEESLPPGGQGSVGASRLELLGCGDKSCGTPVLPPGALDGREGGTPGPAHALPGSGPLGTQSAGCAAAATGGSPENARGGRSPPGSLDDA